ncbi:Ig-like domain-containing protein [Bradyrhizobium lablabi]|uniref:Ig-like domain-containing protein n=1 Tax=Bradyrhizobium lablabi TaxID=722472 RepID=UPI001BA53F00|nr:Ig-like domain-containing protein [Bradyrhizobium lablabi]MBR0697911.1 family 16 glycosylhydrolase [Bradyrhizobium lablabi]
MTANPTNASVIAGTSGSDILFGGAGNDLLTGGAGNDIFAISKGYGSDTISDFQTGVGGDVLRVQNYGFATFATFLAAARQVGSDTVVSLSSTETLTLQNVTLSSLVASNVVLDNPLQGSASPNTAALSVLAGGTLTGGAMNDSLQASGTGVTLIGGTGDDSYFMFDHNTKVVEQAGQGIDTVYDGMIDGYSLVNAPNVENLILGGSDASPATGNDLDNIIVGNAGNNVMDGGKGNDVLNGLGGIDTFIIAPGNGNDIISGFTAGVGGDILQLNDTGFQTLSDVIAAMKQVGTDTVLTLGSGETLRLNNTKITDFTAANVNIVTHRTDLVQTFNDDFNTLSAGQDPHMTWRTSYAWSGAASYSLAGEQQIYVDPSFSGLPGSQAPASLGLDPFSIQDGHLVITAQPLPSSDAAYVGGHQFSSGMISTQNSFVQTYGYFQMTATLSGTPGAWPAFWMLPTNPHGLATELDVLEGLGTHPDQSHWGLRSSTTPDQGYWSNTANLTAGQHTFAVEWTPYTLTFFVDGAEVGQVATPSDMNTAMYMIANLAMGGSWAGNATPDATANVSIDSITAYQLPEYTLANYSLLASATPTGMITGTASADTLTGTSGNDLIDGGGGADTLTGGAGDDTYLVSDPNAKIVEGYGGGIDTVKSSVTYTLRDYVENLTLTGTAAIGATGNSQSNIITGNDGANVITGGLGNDILTGGGGADTFVINAGDGSDIITDFTPGSGAGHDVVQLNGFAFTSFSDIQAAMTQVGNDVYLALTSQDTLVFRNTMISSLTSDDFQLPGSLPVGGIITSWINGSASSHMVYGTSANDKITAFNTDDTMVGWTGDDTYGVSNVNQKIVENRGGGIDSVEAWSSYTLPDNVENLTMMLGGVTGTGNQLANRIVGSSGDDTLNGGGGNDWIFGGAGNDTFVYTPGSGNVTIADFHVLTPTSAEQDKLTLKGYDASAYLTNVGDVWTVHYARGTDTLKLVGVSQLTSSDVSFVTDWNTPMTMTGLAAPTASFAAGSHVDASGFTAVNQLTLTGSAQAGVTVEIFDQATLIGTTIADATGAWSFATGTLSDGSHILTGKAADALGNLSAASATLNVTVDTQAPVAPSLVSAMLASGSTVTASGAAEAGSIVKLYDGAVLLGTTVAASNGSWSINTGSLATGAHKLSATSTDEVGNQSSSSNVLAAVVGTSLEAIGTTSFTRVGSNYYMSNADKAVLLKYGGATVTAGQFGTWSPVAAEATSSGYDVAWKDSVTGHYAVWTTDSNGNFASKILNDESVTSSSLESIETVFHQDLNRDGVIGVPPATLTTPSMLSTTSIEASGATSLDKLGNTYLLDSIGGGQGPSLKYAGAPVVAGQFGTWAPVGAEATSDGYHVAWKDTVSGQYAVWSTDNNGNFSSKPVNSASGTDASLKSAEAVFHQDLNGDGVINTPSTILDISGKVVLDLANMGQSVTIEAGARLELTGAASGSITFSAATGTLVLDHASQFTGKLNHLSGDGTASNSNQIDLKDIAFGAGTSASYAGDTSGGVLTVVDAQNHAAHLSLVGDYTQSAFNLSSDGSGGTLVIDPPKDGFDFGSIPVPAAQAPTAAWLAGDGFAFDHANPSASPVHLALDTFTHQDGPAVSQSDSLQAILAAADHSELLHFAAPVDAHLAEFHNYMLHQ